MLASQQACDQFLSGLQGLKHTVIASWYWRQGYLTAMSDLIENELHKFDDPNSVELFFSAHGVPTSYVEEYGDPYKEEIEQCVGMVMDRLRERSLLNHHTLAYQSRVGPVRHKHNQDDSRMQSTLTVVFHYKAKSSLYLLKHALQQKSVCLHGLSQLAMLAHTQGR